MTWRPMQQADMTAVSAISDAVHGDYTEPLAVYDERRMLYPAGCFVLDAGRGVEGYLIVHPWRHGGPPPLGELMGALPATPDSLYLHDLALMPGARGTGAGAAATRIALEIAAHAGLRDVYLLAVNGAETFWASRGFAPVADRAVARKVRATYGDVVYMHRLAD